MGIETGKIEPKENEKVYFLVIEHIKTLAQKGEISFGSKIPSERELMATLGLSRNSIREALRSLENMGIIESRHGQGNFLVNNMGKGLSSVFSMLLFTRQSNYIEISQFRRFIEIGAYLLAMKNAGEEDLKKLEYILEAMDVRHGSDRAETDKKFHDEIIELSGNHLLGILNEALSDMFTTIITEMTEKVTLEEWEKLRECHWGVYESLAQKNVHEGIRMIREHYNVLDEKLEKMPQKNKHDFKGNA